MYALFLRIKEHDAELLIENSTKSHDIYWMLKSMGLNIIVAHSSDLYRITKSLTKNDDNDARELASYMRRKMMGEIEFSVCHIPDSDTLERRELCRSDLNDRAELSKIKRQVRSHLLIKGKSLSKKYSDISSSVAIKELLATKDMVLMLDAKKITTLKERILFTDKMIRLKMMDSRMFDIIWSIPGFGILSAAYTTCMIDNIERFDDDRSFAASMGLTPKLDESADKPRNCGISRRGDANLRRLMCQATFVHIQHSESFITEKYHRLRNKGKHHNEAIVACANSLARLVYTLITRDSMFVEDPLILNECRKMAISDNLDDIMKIAEKA